MLGFTARPSVAPSSSSEPGPIFIGGPDRCGKTTMRTFLTSHPNICISAVGSNLWTYFYGRYGDLRNLRNLERCLQAMLHYRHAVFLKPDVERILRELHNGEASYERLFALLHRHYAERAGKRRWGDQTGLVERYADQIFAAYPGAKFIHMIRDPRDRYEASISLWPNGRGRVGGATARWLYSVHLAKRNLQRYPESYKLVRFESLITDTETVLREVCDFLGEDFTPGMLAMEGDPNFRAGLGGHLQRTAESPVLSADFIGKYRGRISKRELLFMQAYSRGEMLEFSYELDDIRLSPRERLLFSLFDFPSNFLRQTAWRSVEAAQQQFPRIFPRRIASAKLIRS
ncbi:MAG TPA: sulfotransferase [Nitrospiraceae bacterium]|nr:sulfotransferase [Nitrospiraceae bacterium]